jgi:Tfp pilus assembly protein PilX
MQSKTLESNHHKQPDRGERGSVLVIALIMIVLLTIIGISASKTSEIEVMIAGNERVAKENFYVAEGSVRRAVMALENDDLKNDPPGWLYQEIDPSDTSKMELEDISTKALLLPASDPTNHTGVYGLSDIEDLLVEAENWTNVYSQQLAGMSGDARCISVKKGLAAKTSAKATGPLPYDFAVYGRSVFKNGLGLVAVGYRKAY